MRKECLQKNKPARTKAVTVIATITPMMIWPPPSFVCGTDETFWLVGTAGSRADDGLEDESELGGSSVVGIEVFKHDVS